jgi:hypothetical protein
LRKIVFYLVFARVFSSSFKCEGSLFVWQCCYVNIFFFHMRGFSFCLTGLLCEYWPLQESGAGLFTSSWHWRAGKTCRQPGLALIIIHASNCIIEQNRTIVGRNTVLGN